MKIIVSTCKKSDSINALQDHFLIYDTNKNKLITKLNLAGCQNIDNLSRGTGICIHDNKFYGIVLAKEHRVSSRLYVIDLKTGKRTVNKLSTSKAVHSICYYSKQGPYDLILANSTQNDLITIITVRGTEVITEDVYFDFLTNNERRMLNWKKEYLHDDSFHNNCVYKFNDDILVSMFLDYKIDGSKKIKDKHWRRTEIDYIGAVYNLTTGKLLHNNCVQPHSIICDKYKNILFCESGTFKLINVNKQTEVKLNGFTRGICEDKEKGGYWVGLSYHRKLSSTIPGAMLQFVTYDMTTETPINLSSHAKEIYDIIPYIQGRYNG